MAGKQKRLEGAKAALLVSFVSTMWAESALGELEGRLPATPGGTDYRVVYDRVQNISWLADAKAGMGSPFDTMPNTGDGLMSWSDANAWAASLSINGHQDWRLPATVQPDSSCSDESIGPGGELVYSGYNCTGSELGYLFYVHLDVKAGAAVTSSASPYLALFSNFEGAEWWSTTFELLPVEAWAFRMANGRQGTSNKTRFQHFAIAVHDGDVGVIPPARPEPPADVGTQ